MKKIRTYSYQRKIDFILLQIINYNDTAFYEHVLKLVHKELFNILAELDFENEGFSILDEVTMTLSDVMKETQHVYRYSVIDEKVNTNIQQIAKDT